MVGQEWPTTGRSRPRREPLYLDGPGISAERRRRRWSRRAARTRPLGASIRLEAHLRLPPDLRSAMPACKRPPGNAREQLRGLGLSPPTSKGCHGWAGNGLSTPYADVTDFDQTRTGV